MATSIPEILAAFSDEEIEREADRRDLLDAGDDCDCGEPEPEFGDLDRADFEALADAFYLGKTDEAVRLARSIAERATGRNLL